MTQPTQNLGLDGLSLDERTLLAHTLWESVQQEVEASPLTLEQLAEIRRRVSAADAGRIPSVSWEAVKRRLMQRK
jgi:putative addiction module component (TIGR02574 family)